MTGFPITTASQLGATIRGARARAGMTKTDLAERAGVSRRWLVALEAGEGARAELGKILDTLDAVGLTLTATEDTPDPLLDLLDSP